MKPALDTEWHTCGARNRLLFGRLRKASRLDIPGAHDWAAWLVLWENFLDRGYLAT
jgi:hypothetical protein